MTTTANILQQIRIKRNHTYREAARISGVSRNTILNIEKGKASPNLQTLYKLSNYYGLPIPEMIEVIQKIRSEQEELQVV